MVYNNSEPTVPLNILSPSLSVNFEEHSNECISMEKESLSTNQTSRLSVDKSDTGNGIKQDMNNMDQQTNQTGGVITLQKITSVREIVCTPQGFCLNT